MISLESFSALAQTPLGRFAPKPTSFDPGQEEASAILWVAPDGRTKIGVWECTPGRFSADRTAAGEYCFILSGRASVRNADGGGERHLGAGDLLVLPQGWIGEWTIHEPVRKLFLIEAR
jgi:uncharacterized cupin superfamily protein